MHESTKTQAVIELIDAFLTYKLPFDQIMARFFREHRYMGSSDRREIAEFSYDILRSFEKIRFINSKITSDYARFIVVTALLTLRRYDEQKVESVFNGKEHSPKKLTPFDRKFINHVINSDYQFPENAELNYPAWLHEKLSIAFPNNMQSEMAALNTKAPLDIRVNTIKSDLDSIICSMRAEGFDAYRTAISPVGIRIKNRRMTHAHKLISEGYIEIQDEGSQIIALECDVHPGDAVVDFCAGAGGKTLALANLMNNKGRIYATDINLAKLENAKLRLRKAGISNVYCHELTSKWIKRHNQMADVVLVDAPCSGSGTWRRNPDMRFRLTENDVVELTKKQRRIIDMAKNIVKIGGRLVYATCSIFNDENEDQVKWFLDNNPNFVVDRPIFVKSNEKFVKMSPYKTDTDGFFCVKFIRQS